VSRHDVDRLDLRPLLPLDGDGVHWTLERDGDLNVNLVHLDPGHEIGEHVNDEVDVLVVGLDGTGVVEVVQQHHDLGPGVAMHVPKGARRTIRAGGLGLSYLTVHRRRTGPAIGPGPA
jgi:quercetin dioxygenase-like cupin family protein